MNKSSVAPATPDYSLLKPPVYTIVVPVVVVLALFVALLVLVLTVKPQWRQKILAAVCGCCLSKEPEKQRLQNLAEKKTERISLSTNSPQKLTEPSLSGEIFSIGRFEQCDTCLDSEYNSVTTSGTKSSQLSFAQKEKHSLTLQNVRCEVDARPSQEFRSFENLLKPLETYSPPLPIFRCASAKADYCDRSRPLSLSITQLFHTAQMSADLQRASSLCNNEAHQLSVSVKRYDSGFSSTPSIYKSVTLTGFKPQEDPPIGCSHGMITVMRQEFTAMDGRQLGVCYATSIFAIAEVGEEGAILRFQGNSGARLCIPPGAVTVPTIVYMAVRYGDEDTFESYSPTYECGPDGLIFKKIVYLTFPHAAIGSEVMAAMSQQRDKEWKADDGCRTLEMDDNCVTLAIEHFTGFKLARLDGSARSRIPVPVGARTGSGKKLALAAFASCDKVRLYIGMDDALLVKEINEKEMHLGLYQTSPWKPFRFMREQGGLLIQGSCEDCGIPMKCFKFADDAILCKDYDYVEFTSQPSQNCIQITVLQPQKPNNRSHMTAVFDRRLSPGNLTRQHQERLSVCPADPLSISLSTLSISSPVQCGHLSGNHSPVEHCDHMGACNCPREHAESECEMSHCIIRAHPTRASKESGYESTIGRSSISSPTDGFKPLKGALSLANIGNCEGRSVLGGLKNTGSERSTWSERSTGSERSTLPSNASTSSSGTYV